MSEFEQMTDRDAVLEAMVIRQACRASNREARLLSDAKARIGFGVAALSALAAALAAIWSL